MRSFQFRPRSAKLRIKCLTPRQYKVIYLLAQGLTYKQVALQMHISYGTVTSHVYSALDRMHVMTVYQAVVLMACAVVNCASNIPKVSFEIHAFYCNLRDVIIALQKMNRRIIFWITPPGHIKKSPLIKGHLTFSK